MPPEMMRKLRAAGPQGAQKMMQDMMGGMGGGAGAGGAPGGMDFGSMMRGMMGGGGGGGGGMPDMAQMQGMPVFPTRVGSNVVRRGYEDDGRWWRRRRYAR